MFTAMLYFLPSVVCLLWFSTFIFKVKTPRQKVFMWIMALGIYYFATYATYIHPQQDYLTLVMMDMVNVPVIFMSVSLGVLYMWMHYKPVKLSTTAVSLLFMPALVFGAILAVLYSLEGFDNAARLVECTDLGLPRPPELDTDLTRMYVLFDVHIVDICSMLFHLTIIILCMMVMKKQGYRFGDVCRFFFGGKGTTPSRAIAFMQISFYVALAPIVFLGREFLVEHPNIGLLTSVLCAIIMHFIAHVEYFGGNESMVTLHELSHISGGRHSNADSAKAAVEQPVATEQPEEVAKPAVAEPATDNVRHHSTADVLIGKIVSQFEDEEVFRKDDLTLEMLSQLTGIGRTNLSSLINQHYGKSFRDVVNRYRVEAVKKYLLENPSATQEAAAFSCGYKDASSLSHKFRELENETPLMWLTHQKTDSSN